MTGIVAAMAAIKRRNRPAESSAQPTLLEAAKVVVALSGWNQGKQVYQTSAMAVDVLRRAIEETENPTLTLAPEPINAGVL